MMSCRPAAACIGHNILISSYEVNCFKMNISTLKFQGLHGKRLLNFFHGASLFILRNKIYNFTETLRYGRKLFKFFLQKCIRNVFSIEKNNCLYRYNNYEIIIRNFVIYLTQFVFFQNVFRNDRNRPIWRNFYLIYS